MVFKLAGSQIARSLKPLALALVVVVFVGLAAATSATAAEITVYRDPACRCCGGWMEHVAAQGFSLQEVATADVTALKQDYGVPADLTSCHTAIVDGYLIEGHVPVADIQRLLADRPPVAGITVPGMPVGTPGMEDGDRRDPFTVFSFDDAGNVAAFSQYR